jgi:hypothetical protein
MLSAVRSGNLGQTDEGEPKPRSSGPISRRTPLLPCTPRTRPGNRAGLPAHRLQLGHSVVGTQLRVADPIHQTFESGAKLPARDEVRSLIDKK